VFVKLPALHSYVLQYKLDCLLNQLVVVALFLRQRHCEVLEANRNCMQLTAVWSNIVLINDLVLGPYFMYVIKCKDDVGSCISSYGFFA